MALFQQQWIIHLKNIVLDSATEGTANTKTISAMKIKDFCTKTESLEKETSQAFCSNSMLCTVYLEVSPIVFNGAYAQESVYRIPA